MSTQAARQFFEKLANDEALSEKLFSKKGTKQERSDAFVAAGRECGLTFDGHDVESIVTRARSSKEGALDDRELDQVVGGGFWRLVGKAYSWLGAGTGGDDGGNVAVGVRG